MNSFCKVAIVVGIIAGVSGAAYADGLTATGNTLPIGANGTTVLTITGGASPSATFAGPVSVTGALSSMGILTAPVGINVNNAGVLYPSGNASFAGSVAGHQLLITDQSEAVGTACPTTGLLAETSVGALLSCQNGTWQAGSGGGDTVTVYTKQGNLGVHSYCALGEVQNGWNTSIGNNWTYVMRNSDGSWTSSAESDRAPYVVCLDSPGTTTSTNTTTTTTDIVNVSCPTGEVLTGIANGQPVCVTEPTATNVSCPTGQVLTGITNGQAVCATQASVLSNGGSSLGAVPMNVICTIAYDGAGGSLSPLVFYLERIYINKSNGMDYDYTASSMGGSTFGLRYNSDGSIEYMTLSSGGTFYPTQSKPSWAISGTGTATCPLQLALDGRMIQG